MPVLDVRCSCGHEYEVLKSFSTHDPGAERCPKCGGDQIETLPSGFVVRGDVRDKRAEDLDPLEAQMLMENRRHIEENSERVLSGEMKIEERGPDVFRPKLPEHLKKRYY